jgi:putative nucleotidyltransferase with HDIG domain
VDEVLNSLIQYKAPPRIDAEAPVSKRTTIATILGLKDPYTREHARRVAIYGGRLAERIGLKAKAVENIRLGGLLHDVGKIALSAKVLNNTHKQLSDDMLAEVRQHPQRGVAILKEFDLPAAVIDIVRYHHENMDGSGYPFGLRSFQIPLGAKIIRVADCFDAITTDRPYQQHKSWIEALSILRQFSGTDLNPMLVRAFIGDIKENGLALNPARSISLYSPVFDCRLKESAIKALGE